ncbi:rRNA maturation RNase YbeY [Thalassotalea aquiviva]|uniref:rRNA maturation RNase YbeY n=1 Tax=Thalassotalea aquiviva TaxID=3242415 RepID=UPI00352A7214
MIDNTFNIYVDIQRASEHPKLPSDQQIQTWVDLVLGKYARDFELTVRLVDREESQQLNHQYRHKDKPTNVLSFPFEVPEGIEMELLGDLVICAEVVETEAKNQNKPLNNHWAHMIVHGCLHLLGYDHIRDDEAVEMEAIEVALLEQIGIPDPYQDSTND